GFPTDFPKPPFIDPTFSNDRNVAYADPASGRPPVAQNWQLSIERQISQILLVEGAYVGSNGHHLLTRNVRYNHVDPRYLAFGSSRAEARDAPGRRLPSTQVRGLFARCPTLRVRAGVGSVGVCHEAVEIRVAKLWVEIGVWASYLHDPLTLE